MAQIPGQDTREGIFLLYTIACNTCIGGIFPCGCPGLRLVLSLIPMLHFQQVNMARKTVGVRFSAPSGTSRGDVPVSPTIANVMCSSAQAVSTAADKEFEGTITVKQQFDAIVVGAGPAGSSAALVMA